MVGQKSASPVTDGTVRGSEIDRLASAIDSEASIARKQIQVVGRHRLRDRADDLYETPPEAVTALLRVEQLPLDIWEPMCGPGSIVRSFRSAGYNVVATDLVDYGLEQSQPGVDFLMERRAPPGVQCIVSNPPYKLAQECVEHALRLVPRVVFLLRLAFLESERRSLILDSGTLARVYPFANRLPMMHRHGWTGPRASSATAYAWFVWDLDHVGPAEVRRIRWERRA